MIYSSTIMPSSKISVVLGTLNQEDKLKKVLDGFGEQTISHDAYEVIVVDSTSTDGTADLLKNYDAPYHFKYIIQDNQGKAAARNRGVDEASSDLIMITDADMIPHPDLLKTHLEAHQKTSVPTSFEGLTYNMESYDWPPKQDTLSPYIERQYKDGAKLGWWYFLTGNISFPKTTFYELGAFDEAFKGYGWEDLELGYRFFKAKVPHYYLKKAINYHYHVISKDDEIGRNFHKGVSARLFYDKHKELKWFLGMNPFSLCLHDVMSPSSFAFKILEKWYKHSPKGSLRQRLSAYVLGEYNYLNGIRGRETLTL